MKFSNPSKYFITIACCATGFIVGMLVFARGLLLHRDVLPNKSSCIALNEFCKDSKTFDMLENCLSLNRAHSVNEQLCATSNFKIILMVIDALRYDFIEYDENISNSSFFTNKLTVIRRLLSSQPKKARLWKFIADPPTTTMQRILGLTTGSLPTFIDVGSNFASSEINEDNIIDLLNREGKHSVFMGDDTWTKLYPNRFVRSYPFDSFNVWDLDSVDRGIQEHLDTELRKHDWHLFIAHFLGVDHCGHRYGPDHPEMKRKLEEMNTVIESVVNEIEHAEDTLLIVLGDHGMTSTGDHGGDTENEVTTALFVYSPVHDLYGVSSHRKLTIRQVDLAPTISSILGLPIPFSSVGSVILECLPVALVSTASEALFYLWRNVEQITNYVLEYSSHNSQLKATKKVDATLLRYQQLKGARMNIGDDLSAFAYKYHAYMANVLSMFHEMWVQFDAVCIGCGLCFVLVMCVSSFCICETLTTANFDAFLPTSVIFRVFLIICSLPFVILTVTSLFAANIEFTAFVTVELVCIFVMTWRCRQLCCPAELIRSFLRHVNLYNVLLTLAMVVSLCGLFSNSFIIEEPSVILFLILSLLWLRFLFYRPRGMLWTHRTLLLSIGIVSTGYRVALEFLKCHEEQIRCRDIVVKKYEARLCIICVLITWLLVVCWWKTYPPKVVKYVTTFCTLLLTVYWLGETFFDLSTCVHNIPSLLLPLISTCICYLLVWRQCGAIDLLSGLHAAFVNVSVVMALFGCVVLGQTYAIPVMLMIICIHTLTTLLHLCRRPSDDKIADKFHVPWSDVVLWAMSSIYWFYATGHYASFSGIQWNAAFLLQKEIGNNMLVPGVLVMTNTFFSYLVHGVTLPLLLIAKLRPRAQLLLSVRTISAVADRGNPTLRLDMLETFYHAVFVLTMKYLTFFGVRLFFVLLSTTILSRHLMMWKIFAPKFIFEAIAFAAVTVPSVLVGFLYVCRIGKWIRDAKIMSEKRVA